MIMIKYLVLVLTLLPGVLWAQQSLQERIDTAAPGDTIHVGPGTYTGSLLVDRPIALIGRDRPILEGNEEGHVVTVRARRVTIDGFAVRGSGTQLEDDHAGILVLGDSAIIRDNRFTDVLHGIYVRGADHTEITGNRIAGPPLRVEHLTPDRARQYECTVPAGGGPCEVPLPLDQRGNGIHIWKSTGNRITHNSITETRDGIYFSFADDATITHNTIRNVRYGLHYMYSDDNVFEYNTFGNNASGSAIMYSSNVTARNNVFRDNRTQRGYGLLLQSVENATFVGNRLTRNGTGVYLENSTRNVFRQNTIGANYRGLRLTGSSMDNRFGTNVIRGNLETAAVAGISETNAWQIEGIGNYWGPRGLIDLDSDNISELPHRTLDVIGDRRETFPYVGLLTGSPGLALLSEALQRAAVPGIPAITDDRPLMEPPPALDEHAGSDFARAFILVLLTGAAGVLFLRKFYD
jgi:nitrous oxidase accessory protein